MLSNMKISSKINLGFAAVIAITLLLGAIAIFSMANVSKKAEKLAQEIAPTAAVANNVERAALMTRYNIRKYGYIGDGDSLKKGQTFLASVESFLKEASSLAEKKDIPLLAEKAKVATEATGEYAKFLEETIKIQKEMDDAKVNANTTGAKFGENIAKYIVMVNQEVDRAHATNNTREAITSFKISVLANDIIDAGAAIRLGVWKAIASRDPKLFEEQYKKFDIIYQRYEEIIPLEKDDNMLTVLKNVKLAAEDYRKEMENFLKAWYSNEEIMGKRNMAGDKVAVAAEETTKYAISQTIEASNGAESTLSSALWVLVIGLIACFFIAFALAYITVKNINTALNATTNDLASASQQVSAASKQLSSASEELSSSSSEQASSIEETSSSLEEISGMIENNLRNAEKAKDLSDQVKKIADKGNESMVELINSMKEILDSNNKIEDLVKVIGEIGEKTKVIDEIVFQTKLLSFNASVEAERAGEHGRGFAVVAQEVGNLAQMSGKAALEISSIVNQSIKNAEVITRENKIRVEKGNGLVQETAQILREAAESAETVSSNTTQVVNASREQESGIKQIGNAMEQLNKATQQNASIAEEAASSSEELAAQGDKLRELVDELVAMVRGRTQGQHYQKSHYEETSSHSHSNSHTASGSHNIRKISDHKILHHQINSAPPALKMVSGSDISPTSSSSDKEWEKL